MLSGSEAPRGPHPAGPALARRRAQPQPARGAPYPKILARRAGGPQRRGAPGVRAPEGRRPHAALATTYRSWEGSWGPWVSLPGCAWRWPSSSEPAQLRSVAWPPSCHLSSPGPGDARGRRLMQGGSAITFHGSEPGRTPLLPARAACRAPQTSPGAGICEVPAPTLLTTTAPAATATATGGLAERPRHGVPRTLRLKGAPSCSVCPLHFLISSPRSAKFVC